MRLHFMVPLLIAAAIGACNAGDAPVTVVDSGSPPVDTGNTPVDTGNTPVDTGNTPVDNGPPPTDEPTPPPVDVPPVDTNPTCMSSETLCGGGCVDTSTSPLHCGMCDRACGSSEVCMGGMCRPSVTCMSGQTLCGGGCVNTMTDGNHCGMCGRACSAMETCTAGACVAMRTCPMGQTDCMGTCIDTNTSNTNCGACGMACASADRCMGGTCVPPSCPSGQTQCMGACVNTQTDAANCGMCGTACSASETCTAGRCVPSCAAPRQLCTAGGVMTCVDTQTDAANCGSCGMACTSGRVCTAGSCACAMGRTACSGACVDTMTDTANCGRCGNACGMGQTCVAGACACPMGQTACGTRCVDVQSDVANCGRCGTACTAPATCNMGMCNSLCGTGTTSCGGRCVAVSTFLTDNANCGRCGNACGAGTSCVVGVCRPTNDLRLLARTILPNPAREVTASGTTVNATHDGPDVMCSCTSGGNVWYRFTLPTGGGVVYFDTAGSAYDTSLFITDSAGVAVPAQTAAGFTYPGLCNDDALCGTGGGFTDRLQSRTAGVLAAGTYYVAVGGCGSGAFTLRMQFIARGAAQTISPGRLTGTGNTGSQTLAATGVTASTTCGGAGGAETLYWFLTCGATERQLFSTCRSDVGASFTRRTGILSSSPSFDPVMYVRSAQTGAQVSCNDDGTGAGTGGIDCRGTILLPPFLDTLQRGSRLTDVNTPRGLGAVLVDTLGTSDGMRFNMRFQAP